MELLPAARIFFFFLVFFLSAVAHPSSPGDKSLYIVHMDKSSMPVIFTDHHQWYKATVESFKSRTAASQLIYSYDHALHGFSAMLSMQELEKLKKSQGFVSAYPDRPAKLRTTHTTEFLSLSHSTGIWPQSGYGKDVVIGVVDSGIWPESNSFRDEGMTAVPKTWKGICQEGQEFNASMCNLKLIGARFFNKGLLARNSSITISMDSARDTDGHGTHVSSTAAGNYVDGASFFGYAEGTAKGVAPRARLAIYKISWDEGYTMADIVAGIDQAVADGVHILSLSIGFDFDQPWYENPIAISCFAAMEKGIVVSHAGGNTGPGIYSLFDSIPWTVTVGAGTIDRSFTGKVTLGNGLTIDGWSKFPASALVYKLPLYYNKTLSCASSQDLSQVPTNSVIVCDYTKGSPFHVYSDSFNFAGVILISALVEDALLFLRFPWPGVLIDPNQGAAVIRYATTSNTPQVTMTFQQTLLGKKPAPLVSYYSSRGPSRTYPGLLKPDILAPGSLVLAAWVPNKKLARIGAGIWLSSQFNLQSGTSMACPHIAGVAALLKSIHPSWSPAAIKSAMMTTANPLDNTNNPISDSGSPNLTRASALAAGSGHTDPNRSLDPGLVYDVDPQEYVNLMCSMGYTREQLLTVTRSTRYSCSNPSSDLNYPSFISIYANTTTHVIHTFHRIVTNVGNATSTYRVEVAEPAGSKVTVLPTELVFSGRGYEKKPFTLRIEYYVTDKNVTATAEGWMVWVEQGGRNRTVRSPIVIAPSMS